MPGNELLQPEDKRACVLYDASTGRVVHVHRVTTLPGGRKLDDAAMETRIRELAKWHGEDSPDLRVLHVDPEEVVVGTNYTVDVVSKKLRRPPEKGQVTLPTEAPVPPPLTPDR